MLEKTHFLFFAYSVKIVASFTFFENVKSEVLSNCIILGSNFLSERKNLEFDLLLFRLYFIYHQPYTAVRFEYVEKPFH